MAAPLPLPALHATHAGIWLAEADGTVREASRGEAIARAAETPLILLNAPLTGQRLGYPDLSGLDLLELFAFIHPARFAVPTLAGLARPLGIAVSEVPSEAVAVFRQIAEKLLDRLGDPSWPEREGAWTVNASLDRLGWAWAPLVGARLERPERGERILFSRLKQWEEMGDKPPPLSVRLGDGESTARLDRLTGEAEVREGQKAMAEAANEVFAAKRAKDSPNMLLAEAGTGIGKTLAYLAPASLWAERSGGTVWVSTYTKALQRQLDAEGSRSSRRRRARGENRHPKGARITSACSSRGRVRRVRRAGGDPGAAVGRGRVFEDGDMVGGDLRAGSRACFRRPGRPR